MSSTDQATRDGEAATTPTTTTPEGHYWERRRAGALPWVIGAVGLLGLGIAYDVPVRHAIEDTLQSRSREALDAAGAQGVVVDFTGRDAVLTGSLPAGMTEEDLITRLEDLDGVRVVRADFGADGTEGQASGSATPTGQASPSTDASAGAGGPSVSAAATSGSPPSVTVAAAGGEVTLSGGVPSQADADALVAAATARYGEGNVTDELTVRDGISSAGLAELAGLIGALGAQDDATAALSQGQVSLSGSVGSETTRTAVEQAATAVTGDAARVTSQLTVTGAGSGATAAPSPTSGSGSDAGSATTSGRAQVQAELDRLPQITFYAGSVALTPQGLAGVRQAADILKKNPSAKIRVQGHTDDIGDPMANQQLSTARARMVRETLNDLGIDDERMSFIGYGQTRPLVPNTSEENRQKNRRVQFLVL